MTFFSANAQEGLARKEPDQQRVLAEKEDYFLPLDIQKQIYEAFVTSIKGKQNIALKDMQDFFDAYPGEQKPESWLYWRAYLQFYASIFYFEAKDHKQAEKEIDYGVDCLEDIEEKSEEEYALLALMQGYSAQFKSFTKLSTGLSAIKYAGKALDMDDENPRTCYVYGSIDYHTPSLYGGGKKAEKYLLKAIQLEEEREEVNEERRYAPTWGKLEAYVFLIKMYIQNSDSEKAKDYIVKALKEYPDNYQIVRLQEKIAQKGE
ncbi:hypothetical protein GCM10023331_17960 [Algivirga pacifica]|uniref:Tetratricopeptide repeat-containing protein n=2 Tax=Algivirga pacifica TaxID=1162670 RepID=A0ABP9D960_9BACT